MTIVLHWLWIPIAWLYQPEIGIIAAGPLVELHCLFFQELKLFCMLSVFFLGRDLIGITSTSDQPAFVRLIGTGVGFSSTDQPS